MIHAGSGSIGKKSMQSMVNATYYIIMLGIVYKLIVNLMERNGFVVSVKEMVCKCCLFCINMTLKLKNQLCYIYLK